MVHQTTPPKGDDESRTLITDGRAEWVVETYGTDTAHVAVNTSPADDGGGAATTACGLVLHGIDRVESTEWACMECRDHAAEEVDG